MSHESQFLHHILNTPSIQAEMQARLLVGHDLETVVISTAKQLGYALTFADITAVLDENPALADKLMALLPAPMLELDEAQLMMIAGGGTARSVSYCSDEQLKNTPNECRSTLPD